MEELPATPFCECCGSATVLVCSCCARPLCCDECQLHGTLIGGKSRKRKHEDSIEKNEEKIIGEAEIIEDVTGKITTVAEVPMLAVCDAPVPPAGKVYVLGTPGADIMDFIVKEHASNHKVLYRYANGKFFYFPVHARLGFYEWARIPNSIFKIPLPDGFEAQFHRDGKKLHWRNSPNDEWRESKPNKPDATGRRRIKILGEMFYVNVIICASFYGTKPTKLETILHYEAGHAKGVAPNAEPHEAAYEISWLTREQNMEDKKIAGTANSPNKGLQQAIWARRLAAQTFDEEVLFWTNLGFASEHHAVDGHVWARFTSQTVAAKKLNLSVSGVGQVLLKIRTRAGDFTFKWVEVEESAENERKLVNEITNMFLICDGRMLQQKTLANNKKVWIEFALVPTTSGYIRVKSSYGPLSGTQLLHRFVYFIFNNKKIADKIAKTRARNDEIDTILFSDTTLSIYERNRLKKEKNGLDYSDFHIDHIDGVKTNNSIENLQILTKQEHAAKTHGQLVVETVTSARDSVEIATFSSITAAADNAKMAQMTFLNNFSRGNGYLSVLNSDGMQRHFHRG